MEVGRHAQDEGDFHSSIQLLQMPWNNISSRPTSRQPSQDPQARPASRDSTRSAGGVYRSSISRVLDDMDYWRSSPPERPHSSVRVGGASGMSETD
jgi:hypothetical protein